MVKLSTNSEGSEKSIARAASMFEGKRTMIDIEDNLEYICMTKFKQHLLLFELKMLNQ